MGVFSEAAQSDVIGNTRKQARSRKPTTDFDTMDGPPSRKRQIQVMVALVIAGIVIGAILMRLRYNASEAVISINTDIVDQWAFYHRLEADYGSHLMSQIANEKLMVQFAKRQGVAPTAQEVNDKFDEDSAQPEFDQRLAQSHETEDDYRDRLYVTLARIKILARGITETDDDIRKYYAHNIDPKNPNARYYTPDTAQIAVITTPAEPEIRAAQQALDKGNPFEEVARTYSHNPNSDSSGVLPPILRGRGMAPPQLEKQIFSMKVGDIWGPQHFLNNWWIIKCVNRSTAKSLPFDRVKLDCRYAVLADKGAATNGKALDADFREFKRKANFVAFWPDYENALK